MFKWIYGLFESWFGSGLNKYLAGYDCLNQVTNPQDNLYTPMGVWILIITFASAFVYYYVINHPRFNRWWSWMIVLLFSSIVSFLLSFLYINAKYTNGDIQSCLITSDTGSTLIDISNIITFGLTNAVVSAIFFIIISLCIKWFSSNAKYSPFIKF